ncbi:MAG: hypothetical protein ABWY78_19065 [Microvirga sp.]
MTIGIAAYGPRAGQAILEGLRAAESIGRGAIGGFVSFAAIGEDGRLHRAETQRNGAQCLFGGEALPAHLARARHAVLMSSGPDRPAPLAQFTPGDPLVGLVTGHRLPNTPGAAGIALNEEVLRRMGQGSTPSEAVERVVRDNPHVDGGLIALALDGEVHARDTAYVERFPDRGGVVLGSREQGGIVAVLHNAIRPYRSLALLVAETVLDTMAPTNQPDGVVGFAAGVPIAIGPESAIHVDAAFSVLSLALRDPRYLSGRWSLGLGPMAPILMNGTVVAHALYEPYLVIDAGRLETMDGAVTMNLPFRYD